jgi:hypothetical protein
MTVREIARRERPELAKDRQRDRWPRDLAGGVGGADQSA